VDIGYIYCPASHLVSKLGYKAIGNRKWYSGIHISPMMLVVLHSLTSIPAQASASWVAPSSRRCNGA